MLDAIVGYLTEHGLAGLSLRPLAKALGHSTYVLTHHFATKDDLIAAVLDHLDRRQRERLRAFHQETGDRTLGEVIRASWEWHLAEDLPLVRLLHEIEGLSAAGRLHGPYVPRMLGDRADFVAGVLRSHGVPADVAEHNATLLNAAYAGLQTDYLTTGDRKRVEAALEQLIVLADGWTRSAETGPARRH